MQLLLILLLCVASAVLYGVAHDQVTARLCVEYFTIAHPPVFATHDPALLGLGWGVIATWWVGALLGAPLALVARVGPWPRITAGQFVRPVAVLLLVMALAALGAGIVGHVLATRGLLTLSPDSYLGSAIPRSKHAAFFADWFAHNASYGAGFVGGITLWVLTGWKRYRLRRSQR